MLAGAALILLALSAQAPADTAARVTVVTDEALQRIATALAKSQPLRLTAPVPTFRTEVRQHPWFTAVPRSWDFAGGGSPMTAPQAGHPVTPALMNADVLPWLRGVRNALAEHSAREEVSKAVAEFCATHECH